MLVGKIHQMCTFKIFTEKNMLKASRIAPERNMKANFIASAYAGWFAINIFHILPNIYKTLANQIFHELFRIYDTISY